MISFDFDALFLWVLNQSIVASYVIVGVLVVRLLLKRAPKIFSYALWGVVLFRLLCPFSLESTVAVIPVTAQPLSKTIAYAATPELSLGSPLFDDMLNAVLPFQGTVTLTTQAAATLPDTQQNDVADPELLMPEQPTQSDALAQGGASANGNQSGVGVADDIADTTALNTSTQTEISAQAGGAVDAAADASGTDTNASEQNLGTSVNTLQIWLFVGRCIWLLGVGGLLMYSVVSLLRLRGMLANALPFSPEMQQGTCNNTAAEDGNTPAADTNLHNASAQMKSNIPCEIYYSSQVETAFVLGVFRPKIYLPAQLARAEMQYILCHEQTHIRRGDHIIKLLAFLTLCLHWFNPLVWVAFFLCGKDMELSCDESVLKTLGYGIKQEYSASLLSLATGKRILGGAPLAFGEGDTKSRIKNVLRYRKPALWVSVLAVCLLLCAAIALLTTQPEENTLADTSSTTTAAPVQQIVVAVAEDTIGVEDALRDELFALSKTVIQDAVDTLNAAGAAPQAGSNSYYVTDAVVTGFIAQNTGAATECFAVGTYLLEYEITLSTTEGIALPEGYQLTQSGAIAIAIGDAAAQDANANATPALVCTSTAATQPYLYTFGGAYSGPARWQILGVLTYDEIDRGYGGPSMVAIYGDCITASAIKLLKSCVADEVDFTQFTFAAPDGLQVDVSTPIYTNLAWYADINHAYTDDAIWVDYHNFTTREYTGVSVFWKPSYETYAMATLDVTLGEEGNSLSPTLYGIYTDAQGAEYLFAYASCTGGMASLGGTDYAYALYVLSDDGADGELCVVQEGYDCFAPDQTISADGTPLQTVLDIINGYAQNTVVLISVDQTVQYYTADGTKADITFTEERPSYFYTQGASDDAVQEYAPEISYYLEADVEQPANGQRAVPEEPLYMQVLA